jgi:hypothetical protein
VNIRPAAGLLLFVVAGCARPDRPPVETAPTPAPCSVDAPRHEPETVPVVAFAEAPPPPSASLDEQQQRELVDKLKFDVEILKADIDQRLLERDDRGERSKYVPLVGFRPMTRERFAKLKKEAARADERVVDANLHAELKTDVLDEIDRLAASPFVK